MVSDVLQKMVHELKTQDNACTSHPVFLVQRRHRIYGIDPDYAQNTVYLDSEEYREVDVSDKQDPELDKTLIHTGFIDRWEYVHAFFTRKSAEEYIAQYRHRYEKDTLRVYVDSAHNNHEWQFVVNVLLNQIPSVKE